MLKVTFYHDQQINLFLYFSIGITVNSPQRKKVCRAIILQVSADLPARSRLANMKQFNGQYRCLFYGPPLHRFWPDIPDSRLRSHESILKNSSDGTSKQAVCSSTVL